MQDSIDILYNVTGQTIYFDAPEGRPSSVTSIGVFRDQDGDDQTAQFSPSGTVETNPNTTIDAASGAGQDDPTKLAVAATTGFARNRRFLVTSAANGEMEWFECERIVSGDAVYARSPLLNTYATSDTVQSTRITFTVNATWVADETKISTPQRVQPEYRIRWVYVVGGVTYAAATYVDLVRYPWRHAVVGPDVAAYSAGWYNRLPTDDRRNGGERVISEAARQVKEDMRKRGLADYSQRNSEFINGLVVRKAVFVGAYASYLDGAIDPAFMERADRDYNAYLEMTIRETTTQGNESVAAVHTPVLELFER